MKPLAALLFLALAALVYLQPWGGAPTPSVGVAAEPAEAPGALVLDGLEEGVLDDGTRTSAAAVASTSEGDAPSAATSEPDSEAGATFAASVLAESGGAPIPGVAVHVERKHRGMVHSGLGEGLLPPAAPPEGKTDLEGRFELRHPAAELLATFTLPGWGPRRAVLEPGKVQQVVLSRSGRLAGQVLGGDPGTLHVRAVTEGYHLIEQTRAVVFSSTETWWTTRVDSAGFFALEDLPSGVPLEVQVRFGSRVVLDLPERLVFEPGEDRQVQWRVGAGGAIRGWVEDDLGQPVPGQAIWLLTREEAAPGLLSRHAKPRSKTRSNAQGQFAFERVQPGTWTVGLAPMDSVRPSNWTRPAAGQAFAPMAVAAEVGDDGADVTVELVVYRGLYIEGRLMDPGGSPVEGWVSASALEQGGGASVNTGEDGAFRLGPLVSGAYRVGARAHGSGLASSETMEVQAGDTGIEIFLRQGTDLSGRVIDAGSGEPTRAVVHLNNGIHSLGSARGLFRSSGIEESSRGDFRFRGLSPARVNLVAATEDGRVGVLAGIELRAGTPLTGLEIRVEPGAVLVIPYTGPEELASYRVLLDGVLLSADAIRSGSQCRISVPAGKLEVGLLGERREVQVAAGEELVVEFDLPE